jgi:hypothetical protein
MQDPSYYPNNQAKKYKIVRYGPIKLTAVYLPRAMAFTPGTYKPQFSKRKGLFKVDVGVFHGPAGPQV